MNIIWGIVLILFTLLLNSPFWVYFGLVGGGMYLYFAGRGIVQRLAMQRSGIRIGEHAQLKWYYAILSIWGLIAIVTIIMAVVALPVNS